MVLPQVNRLIAGSADPSGIGGIGWTWRAPGGVGVVGGSGFTAVSGAGTEYGLTVTWRT
jgi:hypothetical protein